MLSTAKQENSTAHEIVRRNPFTRVHGRPTRTDYDTLKEEMSALACEVEDNIYPLSKNATGEYGLLADITGDAEYTHLTGITTYQVPTKLEAYNASITNAAAKHTCKQKRRGVGADQDIMVHTKRIPQRSGRQH